jgi:hypothetical protein
MDAKRQTMKAIRRQVPQANGRPMSGRQWVKLRKALARERRHAQG